MGWLQCTLNETRRQLLQKAAEQSKKRAWCESEMIISKVIAKIRSLTYEQIYQSGELMFDWASEKAKEDNGHVELALDIQFWEHHVPNRSSIDIEAWCKLLNSLYRKSIVQVTGVWPKLEHLAQFIVLYRAPETGVIELYEPFFEFIHISVSVQETMIRKAIDKRAIRMIQLYCKARLPLHSQSLRDYLLWRTVNAGKVEVFRCLVADGLGWKFKVDADERNILHRAVSRGHFDFIKELLKPEYDLSLDAEDKHHQSCLDIARDRHYENASRLIERAQCARQDFHRQPSHFDQTIPPIWTGGPPNRNVN